MNLYLEGDLILPIGKARYAITDGQHVHISNGYYYGGDYGVIIRGKTYTNFGIHLFQQADKLWSNLNSEGREERVYLSAGMNEASSYAKNKLYEVISEAWNEFIIGKEALLQEAELKHLTRKRENLNKEMNELQDMLDKMKEEREKIDEQIWILTKEI